MRKAEQVPDLVHQHGEQVHAPVSAARRGSARLAGAARSRELLVVARRAIDEPAPTGGIGVDHDDMAHGLGQGRAV